MEERNNNTNGNIVAGYCFKTAQDAETARQEEKKSNTWKVTWIMERRRTCC